MLEKNEIKAIKVVCFVARDCGIETLKGLILDKRFLIKAIFTHGRLPKSEDQNRGPRSELSTYKEIANSLSAPLITIDSSEEASNLSSLKAIDSFDFLISVSWRYLIPKDSYSLAKIGAINVHRGKLPEYAGAEPIKRALEHNESEIILTAHKMEAVIDSGEILVEEKHLTNTDSSKSISDNVDRLKKEILPLYPKATIKAIESYLSHK